MTKLASLLCWPNCQGSASLNLEVNRICVVKKLLDGMETTRLERDESISVCGILHYWIAKELLNHKAPILSNFTLK